MSRFISYRKTQEKGDWLIFEAIPYTDGIGVRQVGSLSQGYTTGHQFGRTETECEAKAAAQAIAQEMDMVLVPYEPPRDPNPRFIDLPKKFPTKKEYSSKEIAEADGWIYINPSKTLERYRGRIIKCVDVTPDRSFGTNLAIKIVGHQEAEFAQSQEIWVNNRISARFRMGDVVDAILAAGKWIDEDLLSISEVAELTGKEIWKVSQWVQSDKLTGYYPNESRGRGRHGAMVSREELKTGGFLND